MLTFPQQTDQQGETKPVMNDHRTMPLWRLLLRAHDHDRSFQPTLNECKELLEYDAELLADGEPLDKIRPDIAYHLALCSPYRKQLNDWVNGLVDHKDRR